MAETWILALPEKMGKHGPENEKKIGSLLLRFEFFVTIGAFVTDNSSSLTYN